MNTELSDLKDGPETKEPITPVTKKPTDLTDEPETEENVASVTKNQLT